MGLLYDQRNHTRLIIGFTLSHLTLSLCACLCINLRHSGSGEGHTAYIYLRSNQAPKVPTLPNQSVLSIPGRLSLNEADSEVYCDQTFFHASQLAVGPVADLRAYVKGNVFVFIVDAGICVVVCLQYVYVGLHSSVTYR